MKNIILTAIAILFTINTAFTQEKGTFTDTRDGKTYKTVKIGKQVWMAENLTFKTNEGCWAYENDPENAKKYGYLYNLKAAQTSCPSGWRLPSYEDLTKLAKQIKKKVRKVSRNKGGSWENLGTILKSTSGWEANGNGTDDFGFSALPAGSGATQYFSGKGNEGFWWLSAKSEDDMGIFFSVYSADNSLSSDGIDNYNGFSVRCIKNN